MKQMLKKFFSIVVLLSTTCAWASTPAVTSAILPVAPYLQFRSQGVDAADELAGWTNHVNLFDMDCLYGSFAIKPKYTRSFRNDRICQCLFGVCNSVTTTVSTLVNNCNTGCNTSCNTACNNPCGGCSLKVSGSRVLGRGATDLLADYFYLPTDFQSTLNFNPTVDNIGVDLNMYFGFDEWIEGLFLRIHIPVFQSRWNLRFSETAPTFTPSVTGGAINGGYEAGYFAFSSIPTQNLNQTFAAYANGGTISGTTTPSIVFNPLNFARIDACRRTSSGVADLQFILGYNFVDCEDYHLGLGLYFSAPTGTRPTATYLFEPIVGNGKHWTLGAHVTSHANLWRSCDEESSLGFYLDCNITHLFKARQRRTFDLVNRPLSRYMLAERLGAPSNALAGDGTPVATTFVPSTATTPAVAAFANEFTPVANLTTRDVNVSIGVQGDLAAQFTYAHCGFAWDLGYNFWGRSCEKFCPCPCPTNCNTSCDTSCNGVSATPITFEENVWALKGDSSVYGEGTVGLVDTPIPLSATQTSAVYSDITGGSNFFDNPVGINAPNTSLAVRNASVENPLIAYAGGTVVTVVNSVTPLTTAIFTSIQPVFLTAADIDLCRGTRGLSHKLYTNLSYQWLDNDCWVPFLGVGAFGEWGSNDSNCNTSCNTTCDTTTNCNTNCNTSCAKCSLSQWGVWAKFGVSFN